MTAVVLDGKATAAAIKAELAVLATELQMAGVHPGLGTLLVGDDPASKVYVAGKHRDCAEVGIESVRIDLPATASAADVRSAIDDLNAAKECTGYIVQLPLPEGIDAQEMLERVDPDKDADGLHPTNLGRLVLNMGEPMTSPLPCTPNGIVELLNRYDVPIAGREVAIIGNGITVGRPLSLLLSKRGIDATVTAMHSRSQDLASLVRRADIVVAAAGAPHLVQPDWVKPGAAVLDVGITRVESTTGGKAKLTGDVDPRVAEVAGWMAPNPGGVGPMTRAMLIYNVVHAAAHQSARALAK